MHGIYTVVNTYVCLLRIDNLQTTFISLFRFFTISQYVRCVAYPKINDIGSNLCPLVLLGLLRSVCVLEIAEYQFGHRGITH